MKRMDKKVQIITRCPSFRVIGIVHPVEFFCETLSILLATIFLRSRISKPNRNGMSSFTIFNGKSKNSLCGVGFRIQIVPKLEKLPSPKRERCPVGKTFHFKTVFCARA